MRHVSALVSHIVVCALVTVCGLSGCTPKPAQAEPVARQFWEAVANRDFDSAAAVVDQPDNASEGIEETFEGLQAEGLDAQISSVDTSENTARADVRLTWRLPRGREFSYQTTMNLTQQGEQWTVRWRPDVIHPKLGAHQHLELRAVDAERASVVSSDGVALLTPGIQHRLLVNTDEITDVGVVARRISAALQHAHDADGGAGVPTIEAKDLEKTLTEAEGKYSVALIPDQVINQVTQELSSLSQVSFNEEPAMVTPDPNFAPDIMSRVRTIVHDDLDGTNGWRVSIVTNDGAALDDVEYHRPEVAPAVGVSIDYDVQRAAQEAVDLKSDAKAMLVAIRPSSGEILAVAQTAEADKDGDVALMGQYPPGSTLKMITATAGIENQGLAADSIVPCPGTMDIYGRTVTNYNGFSLGNVPLETAFARSCNTTFADISTKLETGQLNKEAKSFGIGLDYEIPGLDTITGSVPDGEEALDRTEAGYGQGLDLVSPFGMALAAATAAHGSTPTPTLIEGHETKVSEKVQAPTKEAIAQLQRMMKTVVTSGTAAGMSADGDIRGKTGEAEISGGSHAWFAGYRDDLAFATLVVLGGGSEVSVQMTDAFFHNLDKLREDGFSSEE